MTIDVSTIAGITALASAVASLLKRVLATNRYLAVVPIWVYLTTTSLGLTWGAHEAGYLQGDLHDLFVQGLMASLMATGTFEQIRNFSKPLADSATAMRIRQNLMLILAATMFGLTTTACASSGTTLAKADTAIHDSVRMARSTINVLCDTPVKATTEDCRHLNGTLALVIHDADAFNRGVASNSSASAPSMLS